jgi:acyl carrier protein
MTNADQLNHDLETILELEAGSITGTETLADINWDSLSVITFIALADSEYGLTIPASKLQGIKTVPDLLALTTALSHKRA